MDEAEQKGFRYRLDIRGAPSSSDSSHHLSVDNWIKIQISTSF